MTSPGNSNRAGDDANAANATRSSFFVWMAVAMLLLNLVGFAPSWFLNPWIDSPELPLLTHIHGVIFSAWFVVLVVQTSLIRTHRVQLHRTLGAASLTVAVAMVLSACRILYDRAMEYHSGASGLQGTTFVVWGNLALLCGFTLFVALGYLSRRQPSHHKRLMLLASIAMMPQALGRLGYIPSLRILDGMMNNVLYGYGGLLALLLALVIHDRISAGRVHPISRWGVPTLLVLIVSGTFLVPQTEFGADLIRLLG